MRVHLVDGTFELFRAHHSPRPGATDPDGVDVKATVGLVASLLRLLEDEQVTHVAVAFDNPIESFRNDLLDGYKDSTGVDPALLAQFDRAEEATRALGVTVWSNAEHEADDAMGTAALRYADDVDQVRICSPDKDLGQVVRGDRIVQVDRMRDRVHDEQAVRERRGVGPASIPDLLALVGDRADGIPGVSGFGDKTAAAVLARYGHLEDIPEDGSAWDVQVRGAERLARTLVEHHDEVMLYRRLTRLVTDVALVGELEGTAWHGVPAGPFGDWCDRLGAGGLRDRPHRWADAS